MDQHRWVAAERELEGYWMGETVAAGLAPRAQTYEPGPTRVYSTSDSADALERLIDRPEIRAATRRRREVELALAALELEHVRLLQVAYAPRRAGNLELVHGETHHAPLELLWGRVLAALAPETAAARDSWVAYHQVRKLDLPARTRHELRRWLDEQASFSDEDERERRLGGIKVAVVDLRDELLGAYDRARRARVARAEKARTEAERSQREAFGAKLAGR